MIYVTKYKVQQVRIFTDVSEVANYVPLWDFYVKAKLDIVISNNNVAPCVTQKLKCGKSHTWNL